MERLTKRDKGGNAFIDCDNCEIKYRESCCSTKLCTNNIIRRLAAYEDAEEQGRLVVLPCKVGDMLYYRRGTDVLGDTVERIIIDGIDNQVLFVAHKAFLFCDFGRNVFLTREEAEKALKENHNGTV